jgi:hypothetical protein
MSLGVDYTCVFYVRFWSATHECPVGSKSYSKAFVQRQKLLGKKNHDMVLESGQFDVLIR